MALFGKTPKEKLFGSPRSGVGAGPQEKPAAKIEPQKTSSSSQQPKTLFGEKKDLTRAEFLRKAAKDPFRGKPYHERKKMLNEALSPRRFSTYISEGEVKRRLRELRGEEYRAKTGAEKLKIGRMRKYLERQTGLHGKY